MDKKLKYSKLVKKFLLSLSGNVYEDQPGLKNIFMVSSDGCHYYLTVVGWHNSRYTDFIAYHIEVLENGLIAIRKNNSDNFLSEKLADLGIQKSDIIFEETEGDQKQALAA